MTRHVRIAILLCFLLACWSFAGAAGAATAYARTDLGTLGGFGSLATDINNAGQLAGISWVPGDASYHAFFWTPARGMIDVGTLGGGDTTRPEALSESGQVVGWGFTAAGVTRGFSWTEQGGIVDLGTLGGTYSSANDVNAAGLVVGAAALRNDAISHAFAWTKERGMVDLGTLGGSSWATAVNESGQVVGASFTRGESHAFIWTEVGGMVDLGTLNGVPTIATAISNSGQVVGYSYPTDGRFHAFSWTAAGGMVDLGTFGGNSSIPSDVNDDGLVVGHSAISGDYPRHAFAWTRETGLRDLGTLGGEYSSAAAVNASGQIVGDSESRAFSWTPGGGMVDLRATGGVSSQAWDVNDAGEIAGVVYGQNGYHAVVWKALPADATKPTLALPDGVSVDATSPGGAVVEYVATATDDTDPEPALSCSPSSGSEFAIGDATVSCTATDASGNSTSGTFVVHVRNALEQLRRLAESIQSLNAKQGMINSLDSKLGTIVAALEAQRANDSRPVCAQLGAFVAQVQAQSGNAVPELDADALIAAARRIEAVIPC